MRLFACPACGATLYFRNLTCGCGQAVAWDPDAEAFVPAEDPCANRAEIHCNWIAEERPSGYCRACAMTDVVPDTFHAENRALWAEAESAKRWVLANLAQWGWFTADDPGPRPVFHLLAETTRTGQQAVTMGHAAGLVTINVTEADPAERVERRDELGERLRTMTGHFRHEIAHFLFERLRDGREGFAEAFRALMGDERADYAAALERHYTAGAPADWHRRFVTRYASAHPHEDWAETAAHLMHLTDIADSADAAGLRLEGQPPCGAAYAATDADALVSHAAALGLALNHVNRAMGLQDLYPFVLNEAVRDKLAFVHGWIRR